MGFRKIRIGQIGIGHNHASEMMAAFRKLSGLFEVVGIVEESETWWSQRGHLACYEGIPRMKKEELFAVPGLEAVAVEEDVPRLTEIAMECAGKNLHIHMDKPGPETLAPFRELLCECEKRKLVLQMGYMYRSNQGFQFLQKILKKGYLGEIFEIHAVMNRYDGKNPAYRKWLSQFKGGAVYIFSGHLIDLVVAILGRPCKVTPFLTQTGNDNLFDTGVAVLEYPRAIATVRSGVTEVDGFSHRKLIVNGTEGSFAFEPLEAPGKYDTVPLSCRLTFLKDNEEFKAGTHEINLGVIPGRYDEELSNFAKIIRGEMENPYSYEHDLIVHEALLLAGGYGKESCV